jgi:predicted N-formylglutamate amidohydrolase
MRLIATCEHATAAIPVPYDELIAGARHLLDTHRACDIGAREVCLALDEMADGVVYGECSRLLIDLNRSPRHPGLFSDFSRDLSRPEKEKVVQRWYVPFRSTALSAVRQTIARHGAVLHLSVHSFTPVLNGMVRSSDIGILYDPRRQGEKDFARHLAKEMLAVDRHLSVRMNYPYRGVADGHTTALRRLFDGESYLGIEIEINQRLLGDDRGRSAMGKFLAEALSRLVGD